MDEMAAARRDYQRELAQHANKLSTLLIDWEHGRPTAESAIRSIAHKLAGSGATYGFPAVSQHARAVEHSTRQALPRALRGLIRELRQQGGHARPDVVVVTADNALERAVQTHLYAPERTVVTRRTWAEARRMLAGPPVVVVVDANLPRYEELPLRQHHVLLVDGEASAEKLRPGVDERVSKAEAATLLPVRVASALEHAEVAVERVALLEVVRVV